MSPVFADGVAGARPAVGFAPGNALALIVDDSPFLALQLARLLEARGMQVHISTDAAELRELAGRADVVFVELEQFHASGFEVTRELAATCACPVVLLTGTGRSTDRQWGMRAGARAVLPRPLSAEALDHVLVALADAESGA